MKELTTREIAAVKRQFKNSLPAMKKLESINQKLAKLQEERAIQQAILDGGEAGIMAMTGGYTSSDLVIKTVTIATNEDGSTKLDKNGKPVKVTKWEASNNVVWNEEKKVYEITPHEDTDGTGEPVNYDGNYYGNDSSESQLPLNVLE